LRGKSANPGPKVKKGSGHRNKGPQLPRPPRGVTREITPLEHRGKKKKMLDESGPSGGQKVHAGLDEGTEKREIK